MRSSCTALVALFIIGGIQAQTPNYSDDVAPIIYNNCTKCHRIGGIAPFILTSYTDAYYWKNYIASAVLTRTMPPWPPDVAYRSFLHERTLTQDEINTIKDWVDAGAPQGDPPLEPAVPNFPQGRTLPGTPDLTLTMPVYESKADHVDEYKCFPIPSGLTEDKVLRAIEVVPGNPAIVHHVIVFAADSSITDCSMPIIAGQILVGYAPGSPPTVFPSGDELKLGMKLKAGSNIMLQIHYPRGTAGELDSTSVNFYFYPDQTTGIREVVTGSYIQNFIFPPIQPNTVQTIDGYYTFLNNGTLEFGGTTSGDRSLLAVFPHMHLIGRSITSYAVDAANDTIPLVNINNWDFEWQGFYFYKNLVKIPAGSKMYGYGIYDNTTSNHHNPYRPPQTVSVGEATTDEMFLISYLSMAYEPGDENFDLSSLMSLPVSADDNFLSQKINAPITAFPNPSSGKFKIVGWHSIDDANTEITVTDVLGKDVYSDHVTVINSPFYIDIGKIPDGVYFIHLNANSHQALQKIVVRN